MSDSLMVLDERDRRTVAALQLNGRASWKQVARTLGVPESTAARRGQQLLDAGIVHVTGVLDHLHCGLGITLEVRLRCRPGRAVAVAEAVAEMPSSRFVTLLTGSADVAAEIVVPSHRDAARLLVDELPDDVVETESMPVIRIFSAFEEWDTRLLDPAAAVRLRARGTPYEHLRWHDVEKLTEQEHAIATVLAENGRASYAQIAARVGVSESTAARRVDSLVKRGCLRFRTLFEVPAIGLDLEFMHWFSVAPGELDNVGAQLAKQPTSRCVAATAGRFNLFLHGVLPGYGDLYHYTTDVVGALPGMQTADVTLQVRTLKRAWVRIAPDGTAVRTVHDHEDSDPS